MPSLSMSDWSGLAAFGQLSCALTTPSPSVSEFSELLGTAQFTNAKPTSKIQKINKTATFFTVLVNQICFRYETMNVDSTERLAQSSVSFICVLIDSMSKLVGLKTCR